MISTRKSNVRLHSSIISSILILTFLHQNLLRITKIHLFVLSVLNPPTTKNMSKPRLMSARLLLSLSFLTKQQKIFNIKDDLNTEWKYCSCENLWPPRHAGMKSMHCQNSDRKGHSNNNISAEPLYSDGENDYCSLLRVLGSRDIKLWYW